MRDLTTRVVVDLRKMIMNGVFSAGDRVAEIPLAERLKVSRTPVRAALSTLEQEGLLTASTTGSYLVRSFTPEQISDAIDVRGALEGLAARQVAEHGVSRSVAQALRACIAIGDALVASGEKERDSDGRYAEMNERFHRLIVEASGNVTLALALNDSVPFSSANAVVSTTMEPQEDFNRLVYAHFQHRDIVSALEHGEGARAEALMREHSNRTKQIVSRMRERNYGEKLPGGHLISV